MYQQIDTAVKEEVQDSACGKHCVAVIGEIQQIPGIKIH
jgi:hypothetical protein